MKRLKSCFFNLLVSARAMNKDFCKVTARHGAGGRLVRRVAPLALALAFSSTARAEVEGAEQAGEGRIQIDVSAQVRGHCGISGNLTKQTEVARIDQSATLTFPFKINCNAPFAIGANSRHGGLLKIDGDADKAKGFDTVACASTGNLANAVAAAGARAGIKTVVFIPSNLEHPKQVNSAVYTEQLVAVNGTYDDVNRLASEIAGEEDGWAFVNVNVRPFYAEGSKTLGYEIAEQLGWRLPDQVVIPVASGSQLTKVDKAFQELIALGLVEAKPYKIFGAQATGCSPVSAAFKEGHQVVRPVKPDTIAKSLAIGNPADGPYVLDICRRTGGAVEDISDDEVRQGIILLARTEGIFTETAGGTTVGCLKKLVETGQLDPTLETVIINTGMGLKTLDAVSDQVGPAAVIDASYAAFAATGIS